MSNNTNSARKLDPKVERYGKVVEDAKLEMIRLISSSFEARPSSRDDDQEIRRFIKQDVEHHEFDQATGALFGVVHCRCWMGIPPDAKNVTKASGAHAGPDSTVSIEADYIILFKLEGEHNADSLATFFKRVAPLSVWPYFRVHVATLAAEGNLDIPVLPIKKLVHRVKSADAYADPDVE